jgi:glutamate--cysteine ligase catalytic subunit
LRTSSSVKTHSHTLATLPYYNQIYFLGATLDWESAKKVLEYIKKHGVVQFLHIYNERKAWNRRKLLWGDEIEYLVVQVDSKQKSVKLALRGHELLPLLQQPEHDDPDTAVALWRPEYGRYRSSLRI